MLHFCFAGDEEGEADLSATAAVATAETLLASDNSSEMDIGVCIPPFPFLFLLRTCPLEVAHEEQEKDQNTHTLAHTRLLLNANSSSHCTSQSKGSAKM